MILLEQERKRKNMSQQKLAEASGVAQQTISKIESGDSTNPGIETMYRLAAGLGCELGDIYKPEAQEGA